MKDPVVQHSCYTEAKTLSLKLAWNEQRFCFGIAIMLSEALNLATPPVVGALMDQRRVARLTCHLSARDHHKVLLPAAVARRSVP